MIDRYRFSKFSEAEKIFLTKMFSAWGNAILRKDDTAKDFARRAVRACRPGQVHSVWALFNNTPKLVAAQPPPSQSGFQASLQMGGLQSIGMPFQQFNQCHVTNNYGVFQESAGPGLHHMGEQPSTAVPSQPLTWIKAEATQQKLKEVAMWGWWKK